jgi:hypothetical protein
MSMIPNPSTPYSYGGSAGPHPGTTTSPDERRDLPTRGRAFARGRIVLACLVAAALVAIVVGLFS